ncbi:MAG: hypothetical protein IJE97_12845 [Thermoguttaceae bacterium]|nr:hypothetical protein [Thermoguttaceae bacterium]MBQ7028914.1 hypothetical protein [Thermoguttaceae bacterium]MBQ7110015.1 hypothetical protein [Thermoguttaceae bacterium]
MSTLSLESATSSFTSRGVPFRRVDANGPWAFEQDGAAFRVSEPRRLETRVFQTTQAPEFLAFTRDGATLYEPTLSFEAAPVYTPFADYSLGYAAPTKRENLRRTADLTASVRQRVYDPSFLERLNVDKTLTQDDLPLALYAPYRVGDRLNAFWNRTCGRWEILAPPELNVVRFRLTSTLANGSTASADAFYFDEATQTFNNGGLKIHVADFLGRFQGAVGARGYARRFTDRDAWEVFAIDA